MQRVEAFFKHNLRVSYVFRVLSFRLLKVASYAGPLLNITRPSLAAERRVHGDVTLQSGSLLELERRVGFGLGEKQEELGPSARVLSAGSVGDGESELLVEGVPVSEADITASNGVIHRLSAAVMDPPPTVAGVLLAPPYPLSVAGGVEDGGFHALGELIHLAWPLVNETLTEAGPLTFLAPTDAVSRSLSGLEFFMWQKME